MAGRARLAAVSDPMSLGYREDYFKKHGQSPVDIPIAMGALQVLVNKNNPLTHITLTELESIYADNGNGPAVTSWKRLSGIESYERSLVGYGGHPNYGTSRAFARLAMQGKPFHDSMTQDSVIHHDGIQQRVALDAGGIGFVSGMPLAQDVRVVPVAVSRGRDAYLPNAANIYSGSYPLTRRFYINIGADDALALTPAEREFLNFLLSKQGQTEIAKSGLLPLTLEELVHARNLLKLN
jgi:phosphate transport system substrate-binding protein